MAHVSRGLHLPFFDAQDSAYLGNMCTAPLYRRRGYGTHLLRAAERLTRVASYPVIYLHLRRALPFIIFFSPTFRYVRGWLPWCSTMLRLTRGVSYPAICLYLRHAPHIKDRTIAAVPK